MGDIHKVVLLPNPKCPNFCKYFYSWLQLKLTLLVYVATACGVLLCKRREHHQRPLVQKEICTPPFKASSDLRLNPSLCSMIPRKHMAIMLKLFTLVLLCLIWWCQKNSYAYAELTFNIILFCVMSLVLYCSHLLVYFVESCLVY